MSTCPMVDFTRRLDFAWSHISLKDLGVPVVIGIFDPYRSILAAPDHLLAVLSQKISSCTYAVLTSFI